MWHRMGDCLTTAMHVHNTTLECKVNLKQAWKTSRPQSEIESKSLDSSFIGMHFNWYGLQRLNVNWIRKSTLESKLELHVYSRRFAPSWSKNLMERLHTDKIFHFSRWKRLYLIWCLRFYCTILSHSSINYLTLFISENSLINQRCVPFLSKVHFNVMSCSPLFCENLFHLISTMLNVKCTECFYSDVNFFPIALSSYDL